MALSVPSYMSCLHDGLKDDMHFLCPFVMHPGGSLMEEMRLSRAAAVCWSCTR